MRFVAQSIPYALIVIAGLIVIGSAAVSMSHAETVTRQLSSAISERDSYRKFAKGLESSFRQLEAANSKNEKNIESLLAVDAKNRKTIEDLLSIVSEYKRMCR